MTDLIEREDAIKAEADRVYEALHSEGCKETYEECLADAEKTFKDIPSAEHLIYEEMQTADIEARAYAKGFKEGLEARKQGEWISLHNGKWKCSECGIEVLIYAKGNFCPNCGARMK